MIVRDLRQLPSSMSSLEIKFLVIWFHQLLIKSGHLHDQHLEKSKAIIQYARGKFPRLLTEKFKFLSLEKMTLLYCDDNIGHLK